MRVVSLLEGYCSCVMYKVFNTGILCEGIATDYGIMAKRINI